MSRYKVMVLALVAVLMVPSFVLAQNETTGDDEPVSNTQQPERPVNEKLQERLLENRQTVLARLTDQRERLLKTKCEAAQNRLQAALISTQAVYDGHSRLYESVLTKVNDTIARLSATTQIDTTEIGAAAEELQTMVQTYSSDFDIFAAALQAAINTEDCSEDPTDFHSYLELARDTIDDLKVQTLEIRQFMSDELKDALVDIRVQLQTQNQDNDQEEE